MKFPTSPGQPCRWTAELPSNRTCEKVPGFRVIDCGALERASIIEKMMPPLIGLNLRSRCRLGGTRITNLGRRKGHGPIRRCNAPPAANGNR